MTDASTAFSRALAASALAAGFPAEILSATAHDWASATFAGQRHDVRLRVVAGPASATWLAGLAEAEWHLPGHLVADIAGEIQGGEIAVTALTIRMS